MSDSSAQRVRVGPFAVSVDKQKPLIGAKISKVRRVGPVDERARATRLPPPRARERREPRGRSSGLLYDDRLSRTRLSAWCVVARRFFFRKKRRSIRERVVT